MQKFFFLRAHRFLTPSVHHYSCTMARLLAVCSLLHTYAAEAAATVPPVDIVAFGCDTFNASGSAHPHFYSATALSFKYDPRQNCSYASAALDALGPCFASPAEVKAALDMMPRGRRAISLEGNSLYVVEDPARAEVFRDPLQDGSLSPWMDTWAAVVHTRFESWFANFSAIGGEVDVVLSDFEAGGAVYWYSTQQQWPTTVPERMGESNGSACFTTRVLRCAVGRGCGETHGAGLLACPPFTSIVRRIVGTTLRGAGGRPPPTRPSCSPRTRAGQPRGTR